MNQANGFSFEFWRVARCRSRHRVDSLRRLSHPKLWFVRRPGSSPGGCSDGTFRVPSILAHLLLLPVSSVSLAYPYYAINIPERYKTMRRTVRAVSAKESAHAVHASHAAVRPLILPTPRPSVLVPSINTTLQRYRLPNGTINVTIFAF